MRVGVGIPMSGKMLCRSGDALGLARHRAVVQDQAVDPPVKGGGTPVAMSWPVG